MRRSLCFLFFGSLLFAGCNQQKEVRHFYDSGALKEFFTVGQDSLRHGTYVRFAEDGDTLEFAAYKMGKLNGQRRIYTDGNVLEIIEHYHNDTLEGPYLVYYPEGGLEIETAYSKNVLNGPLTKYYPSGSIMERVTYLDNEENGPFTEFYENGQKKWEGTYKDGDNEFGLLVQYSETGDTIKKMMCDERFICRTIWKNEAYIGIE